MITGYFGLPGSGKSSFLTMLARRELKRIKKGKSKYDHVLTNFYCDGCERFNASDLKNYRIDNSLILIDEITLFFDSRDFKNFSAYKDCFIMHRHHGNDIIYFTQQYDGVDKKIRDLTVELYRIKRLGPFSVANTIYRILDINKDTHDIVQGYRFPTIFERLLSLLHLIKIRKWCFRPLYYKYFDSYEIILNRDPFVYLPW